MKQFQIFLITVLLSSHSLFAQNSVVKFIDLPEDFNEELEISGMVGHHDTLYLVAERKNAIFLVNQHDYSMIKRIDLTQPVINYNAENPGNEINIDKIEMEGVTWYKNTLLFVDEGNTNIYKFNLKDESITKMRTNLDLSDFRRSLGMEGISVNPDKKLLYVLRERNGKNQTEIYTLRISANNYLKYEDQKYIINNPNNDWRYSDIYYSRKENVIYGIRSYYDRNSPEKAKCFIDKIPVDENGFLGAGVIQNNDETLSKRVIENRCTYVSNLEGVYKTGNKVLIVSDNRRSSKHCDSTPVKTMFIEYIDK